jgi:hypothetical protein
MVILAVLWQRQHETLKGQERQNKEPIAQLESISAAVDLELRSNVPNRLPRSSNWKDWTRRGKGNLYPALVSIDIRALVDRQDVNAEEKGNSPHYWTVGRQTRK